MVALINSSEWPKKDHSEYTLIKLIRKLNQSTSREIDDEKPSTYNRNRLYDMESEP